MSWSPLSSLTFEGSSCPAFLVSQNCRHGQTIRQVLSDPPGPSKAQCHTGLKTVLRTPRRWLPSELDLPVLPLQTSWGARQDRDDRFQPKAGLGTEASDIQVIWGPSLSHAAKTGPRESHGEAGTPRPPCFPQGAWPGGHVTSPSSTAGCLSFLGEGGLRPSVLL